MSNLCPPNGYPRIIRFVDTEDMPNSITVATLDRAKNLLRVNRSLYLNYGVCEQKRIICTNLSTITIHNAPRSYL